MTSTHLEPLEVAQQQKCGIGASADIPSTEVNTTVKPLVGGVTMAHATESCLDRPENGDSSDAVFNTADPTPFIDDSPPSDSSFSNAYENDGTGGGKDDTIKQDTDVDDDYAMTFDSEEECDSDSQDVSQANVEKETTYLTNTVPASEHPSTISPDLKVSDIHQSGQESKPNHLSPSIHTYEDVASGGIDIQQLLDNITATAANNASASTLATPSSANASQISFPQGSSGLPPHASLPPRPQIPHQPPTRSIYPSQDDSQKYHAGALGFQPPQLNSYRPPGVTTSLVAAGAPGTSTDPRSGLPPPPTASFHPPPSTSAATPINPIPYSQMQRISSQDRPTQSIESDAADDADRPWGPHVQKKYDEFLADERMYVTEGLWDRFPSGSRLFIGNLPTEKVTKRDLFHVFHKYGRIAQVSIKQAYGFVQFHDRSACYSALEFEQGQEVRGRKMHLEISKPQKNTRSAQPVAAEPVRRSRSPDYLRGGRPAQPGARATDFDRYDGRPVAARESDYGRPLRVRDDYRPGRSPSPQRGSYRGRDDYGTSRGRDYYDSRDRRRSRSRSPYGHRDNGRYRDRSLSPRGREANDDADLQIPRRNPHDVPDVQIILLDELDRGFVSWVESELRSRDIKSEIMFLSPRFPIEAVIRRQILEGVHAVSQLDMRAQNRSKIPLQVFDRQGGANNVRFDEYQDLEPKIAAELVLRVKKTQVPLQTYTQPQFAAGQSYQPPAAVAASNLANIVSQLDNATLQRLLGTLSSTPPQQLQQQQPQHQQNGPAAPANSSIDLAGILGGLKQQQQPSASDPYAALASNPALASLLGGPGGTAASQPAQPQSAQQVQNIMAQLAKFRQ